MQAVGRCQWWTISCNVSNYSACGSSFKNIFRVSDQLYVIVHCLPNREFLCNLPRLSLRECWSAFVLRFNFFNLYGYFSSFYQSFSHIGVLLSKECSKFLFSFIFLVKTFLWTNCRCKAKMWSYVSWMIELIDELYFMIIALLDYSNVHCCKRSITVLAVLRTPGAHSCPTEFMGTSAALSDYNWR